ncbi:MAG: hypothetical protein A3D44_01245 [Candidatus Staskawiczbacteria bacterium RIFCSPHIGHO2_02_FULL_42_22]|uniref:Uncharacterized protein n=1 Tax=Candidatus Staskawiczbacteria bacterium RIFCSPHIGHO2_02_FULL_42_22 TaxID=1802207 RepID=A0A1G2I3Q8_9BACT|nr:MAG: hypothetical protein A3D44_01245 [Candidatus Staskawiczbacteria bacterium RIFCSPHIGHO2_02_FULL_42_22]
MKETKTSEREEKYFDNFNNVSWMTKLLFIHSRLARIADNHGFIRGLTRMRSSLRGVPIAIVDNEAILRVIWSSKVK